MNDYTFFTQSEYGEELVRLIHDTKKGDRVLLMSMSFEPTDPAIAAIIDEVQAAAARGVTVDLSIDAQSFMVNRSGIPGPLWYGSKMPKKLSKYYRNKLTVLKNITAQPTGRAIILNQPKRRFSLYVAGRSHIKAAIVNDRIFLGGCNLDYSDTIDMMITWRDSEASDTLYARLTGMMAVGHAGRALSWVDKSFAVGQTESIIIDAGQKNQSLILEEALSLIDSAKRWLVISCQFFPNSITAQHLKRAHERGVDVEVIYAHPNTHGLIGGLGQHYSIWREKSRVPRALFEHGRNRRELKLHAKLIACDTGMIIGSHNYVRAGVLLGTAEVALKSSDEKLALAAVKTLRRALKR